MHPLITEEHVDTCLRDGVVPVREPTTVGSVASGVFGLCCEVA